MDTDTVEAGPDALCMEDPDPLAVFGEAFLDSFDDGVRPTTLVSKNAVSAVKKKKNNKQKTHTTALCASSHPSTPSIFHAATPASTLLSDKEKKEAARAKAKEQLLAQRKEFNSVLNDLRRFVNPKLNKKTKKHLDDTKMLALGGILGPQQKCPYRIRKDEDRNREIKRKKLIEADKFSGVNTALGGKQHFRRQEAMNKKKKELGKKQERKSGHINLGKDVGRENKGILAVSKRFTKKYA